MTSTRYGTVAEFDWILGFQFDLDFSIFENNQREFSVLDNVIKGKKTEYLQETNLYLLLPDVVFSLIFQTTVITRKQ